MNDLTNTSKPLDIKALFAAAFVSRPATSGRISKRNSRRGRGSHSSDGQGQREHWGLPHRRPAASFVRNERGVRYQLDSDSNSPTYNEAIAVNRTTGERINGNVQAGPAG